MATIDVSQALKDTENSLRDFIATVLTRKFGAQWADRCGLSSSRIDQWKERKSVEVKRQRSGVVEDRLIYFADFYDLKNILKKNWSGEFSAAFGEWKRIEVFLDELEKLRDPDAHRRELLPHQKSLIIGIAGEIRTSLVRYRSKMDTDEDCFPRIESVRDSLGYIWTYESLYDVVNTKAVLRPGDVVDFVITASDPSDLPLEYGISRYGDYNFNWKNKNTFSVSISEDQISRHHAIVLGIRSPRSYHAFSGGYDDYVRFTYIVLPEYG